MPLYSTRYKVLKKHIKVMQTVMEKLNSALLKKKSSKVKCLMHTVMNEDTSLSQYFVRLWKVVQRNISRIVTFTLRHAAIVVTLGAFFFSYGREESQIRILINGQ